MKRSAKLFALAGALVVLVGAWLLVESMSGKLEQAEVEEAEAETVDLSAGLSEDITALSWHYGDEAVNLAYDAGSGQWENADDGTCPIDETIVQTLVEAASSVSASMTIPDVTDFSQYGLDEPALTVEVSTADGTTVYELGNVSLTGEYYLRVNSEDVVYTETGVLAPAFEIPLSNLLALESAPTDIATVTGMTVETAVESYALTWLADPSTEAYTDAYQWFAVEDNVWTPLDTEQVTALYETVTSISFLSCETWNATDLAEYGLKNPQGSVVVTYLDDEGTEKTFSLEFGDYVSGYTYVRLVGSSMVYIVSGTVLDGLMYPDWDAMTPLELCPLDWDDVTGAMIEMGGQTYEIEKFTESETVEPDGDAAEADAEQTAEPSDETGTVEVNYYTSNGWTLDSDAVEAWLEELSSLTGSGLSGAAEGREEKLSATFYMDNEQYPEITITFRSYDSTRYICAVTGRENMFVSMSTVENLITEAESILIIE